MKSQNPAANAQNQSRGVHQSDIPDEKGRNVPTLDEIHRRAREIHSERGGHYFDLDNYVDAWLQAERELREKYNEQR
jgi:hypothetical protein